MRCVIIWRWAPERLFDMFKAVSGMKKGEAPKAVVDALKRVKFISFEIAYGQNCLVTVCEGDEVSIATIGRYFGSLATAQILPSISLEELLKLGPPPK